MIKGKINYNVADSS